MQNNKILILDIETSDLDANKGHILCWTAKWYGSKKKTQWRIDDNPNYGRTPQSWSDDSVGVRALVALVSQASAVVAYYGGYGKFDIPFLNTRALSHGLQPCPQLTIIDPYTTAKGKLKLSSNRLNSVAALLKCKKRKWALPMKDWMLADRGDRKAMNNLLAYNENDVLVLEEVYDKLRPLMNTHPFTANPHKVKNKNTCPSCGSNHTHGKGYRYTRYYEMHRRQCQDCGLNFVGERTKI